MFPSVRFAYQSPGFHIALETAAGFIAALAAFLFLGRLKHNRRQGDWALVYALLLSAAVNIGLSAIPVIVGTSEAEGYSAWAAVGARLIAAASFAFAAFAPTEWLSKAPGPLWMISMRERAEALNAKFLVTSSPGRGTGVEVALP